MAARAAAAFGRVRSYLASKEPEFLELHSIVRRAKVRAFIRVLHDPALAETSARAHAAANGALEEHAQFSVFRGRAHLEEGLEAAQRRLTEFRGSAAPVFRDPMADWPMPPDPWAAAVGLGAEESVEKAMLLPHRQAEGASTSQPDSTGTGSATPAVPAPGAMGTTTTPPNPLDLPDPKDVVLDDTERSNVASLRAAAALRQLPPLWEQLVAPEQPSEDAAATGERQLQLERLAEAARALGGTPRDAMRFHLKLAIGRDVPIESATPKQLRAAALRTVETAQPFAMDLLSQSTLLQAAEQAHVDRLRATPKVLPGLLAARTLGMRLRDLFSRPASQPADAVDETPPGELDILRLARERDPAAHRLYGTLASEAELQLALASALFAHHDRRYTRRWRIKLVGQAFVALICSHLLDITISNI